MCKVELLSVVSEAKVGCLSLSWQPAVEERHLTSASSPPSRRVIILRLVSSRMMTTSARFHMLNTLFMELVNALIDGAAKKGLMMTASQPLLHLHCTKTYIQLPYLTITDINDLSIPNWTLQNHKRPYRVVKGHTKPYKTIKTHSLTYEPCTFLYKTKQNSSRLTHSYRNV